MDILSNELTLFIIATLAVTAFLVYSVTAIRKIGIVAYSKTFGRAGKAIVSALGALVASLIALLAASIKSFDDKKASDIAPSGGVLNYRTGKLDEGTNPVGWYEKD